MSETKRPWPVSAPEDVARATTQMSGRLNEYVEVWERAASRLVKDEYHAEDLLDDWFTLWGKWVRDSTAATALAWRAYAGETDVTSGEGPERDER
jgi:hypothetical protein